MRPTIIYVEKDGTLDIDRERLEYLLKEAYEQGYSDGRSSQLWHYSPYNETTSIYRANISCDSNTSATAASELLNGNTSFSDNANK